MLARGASHPDNQKTQPSPRLHDPVLHADFERDGYAVVPGLLDAHDIGQLLEVFGASDDPVRGLPFAATLHSADLGFRAAKLSG